MAWFITKVNPSLAVDIGGRFILFTHAEYHTADADEIAVLRADPRCEEVVENADLEAEMPILRRWLVNLNTGKLHDYELAKHQCYIPDPVAAAARTDDAEVEGWKLYRRRSDALRWNSGAAPCGHCGGGA